MTTIPTDDEASMRMFINIPASVLPVVLFAGLFYLSAYAGYVDEGCLREHRALAGFPHPPTQYLFGPQHLRPSDHEQYGAWKEKYEAARAAALEKDGMVRLKAESMPPVPEGYDRWYHVSRAEDIGQKVFETGLSYSNWGVLWRTASMDHGWVENGDDRFSWGSVIVIDLPRSLSIWHSTHGRAPGMVPSEYVLGVFDAWNNFTWQENDAYYPRFQPPPD